MTKIAVLVGSLRAGSSNKTLARNLEALAPEGVEFEYINLNLPLYNDDLLEQYPEAAQAGKDAIQAADGVLFVTPEYNRSVPGVLKNAIDWFSRPYGTGTFDGKPAGIVGVSSGSIGTAVAQAHLRDTVVYLNTKLLGQPEVYFSADKFDENGQAVERSREFLKKYMTTFIQWVESEQRTPVAT
jgi:chromate reductase